MKNKLAAGFILLLAAIVVFLYFYFDKRFALSVIFRSWGVWGVLASILVMTMICLTPIPAEGLLLLVLKIYGVWMGTLYAWFGAIFSAFLVFVIARRLGAPMLQSLITPARFSEVDKWVGTRGKMGLLFVRLLPIPGFLTSYILATMPSIPLWSFVWTAAVSIIPYYIGVALIYLGFSTHAVVWIVGGVFALALLWSITFMVKKRWG